MRSTKAWKTRRSEGAAGAAEATSVARGGGVKDLRGFCRRSRRSRVTPCGPTRPTPPATLAPARPSPGRLRAKRVDAKKGAGAPLFCLLVAEWTGLEPATPGVTGRYSNQLNYHSALEPLDSPCSVRSACCCRALCGVPTGIRTPVIAVKGRCPRPLDDGDFIWWR